MAKKITALSDSFKTRAVNMDIENTLINFFYNIGIVDILDIGLASCILYFVLSWMRQNVSGRTLAGFTILFIIYTAARFSGMYLTEFLIEGFFIVFLIGIVIVFQSDIRRMVDRIGNWKIFRSSNSSSTYNTATVITEAAANMANKKTGALMVIRGEDNWERLIHGGVSLNGVITVPLLQSIFNPEGPGHDGAVLIKENKILSFGVHLPLSTNLDKMSSGGTRHAAALGLSEQCDALVVVVSEERGTISVAQNGDLQALDSSSDLKNRLDHFWSEHYSSSKKTVPYWWKRSSLQTAIGSVVLAFILWLAFVYQPGTVYRTYEVPIEYRNLPPSAASPGENMPVTVQITLTGSEQAFENFNAEDLVVSFNLLSANAQDGVLEITAENINLPPDLHLFETSPEQLLLNANKK